MDLTIRRASTVDTAAISDLLLQVHRVHSEKRPDIFRRGSKKYTEEQLVTIIADDSRPIYVATDADEVVGYAFCVINDIKDDGSLTDRREIYIDDLCVDEVRRGEHIGEALYNHVLTEGKRLGCYHVTLNVWSLNEGALCFYQKMGLSPMKVTMEKIL